MWDPDSFPGADHVPSQLLVRARYAHWPPKPHSVFDELGVPIAGLVIEQALTMVRAGGSEALQKSLGDVLAEVGGLRG
jgi:hypothetical protein